MKIDWNFILLLILAGLVSYCWSFVFPGEPGSAAIMAVLSSVWLARILGKNEK